MKSNITPTPIQYSRLIPQYKQNHHINYVLDSPDVIDPFLRKTNIARSLNEIRLGYENISLSVMNRRYFRLKRCRKLSFIIF